MSQIWYPISLVLITLLLAALFLYLLRQEHRRSEDANSTVAQAVALKMTLLEQAGAQQDDLLETAREQLRQQTVAMQEFLKESLATAAKSMEQAHLISMNGLQASESSMAKLLSSAVAMLGTKDTLAYHQVVGGALAPDTSTGPYTAVDDAEMERLQQLRDEQANLDVAAGMLERMGVRSGSAGFE